MQPHEWLLSKDGKLLKTDSGSHGDDHFFPGPTDIAWDLAGAIVEWQMNDQQTTEFLDRYRRASGDDASARIDGFIKAYTVFRLAYCLMAANAMNGSDEQPRLQQRRSYLSSGPHSHAGAHPISGCIAPCILHCFSCGISEAMVSLVSAVPIMPVALSRTPRRNMYSPGGSASFSWQGKPSRTTLL